MELWRRGVDTERFQPTKRSAAFRRKHAAPGQKIIGYVGRLALEKQVQGLAEEVNLDARDRLAETATQLLDGSV